MIVAVYPLCVWECVSLLYGPKPIRVAVGKLAVLVSCRLPPFSHDTKEQHQHRSLSIKRSGRGGRCVFRWSEEFELVQCVMLNDYLKADATGVMSSAQDESAWLRLPSATEPSCRNKRSSDILHTPANVWENCCALH